ncbi:MAG TPA: DUF302 domain-containing protein [Polyangiaceae bacterium]|jgi:uncharacterized protein (DUF302 family)|nr:DUF302 domain-containing protein [Polyangiaceae bacterium]
MIAEAGLTVVKSSSSFEATVTRLEAAIAHRDLTLFAKIDHAAGAREAGLVLAPLTLLIFGNARGGTPLMAANALAGIDLPLKLLVGENANGVFVAYNEPEWIGARHALADQATPILKAMHALLASLAKESE